MTIDAAQATPTIASVNAVGIIYGTVLANGQLSGSATFTVGGILGPVVGTFTYTRAAGSLLNAGNGQIEAVTFTPQDTTDYTTAFSNVTVDVAPFTPIVTVTDAGGVYTGSPFAATGTVTGLPGVNLGTPAFFYYRSTDTTFANPLGRAPIQVGNYVAVAFYAANGNYGVGGAKASFAVTGATPTVTSVNPVNITYGTALANSQLSGAATFKIGVTTISLPGTFIYTSALGNVLGAGNGQSEAVTFKPNDPIDFFTVSTTVTVNVAKAATATAIVSAQSPAVYGQQITYTATVTNTGGTGAEPAGTVQFVVDGVDFGSPVSFNAKGQAVMSPIRFLTGAGHSVQAVYIPSPNFKASSASLNQMMQSIAVEGTTLYIGSNGATSSDQVHINPTGSSNSGSTGVQVQTELNGANTNTKYSQVFSAIDVTLQNGNENVQLNDSLVLSALVSAGGGNDSIQLSTSGSNSATLGNGSDNIQLSAGATNSVTLGNGNDFIELSAGGTNWLTLGNGSDNIQLSAGGTTWVTLGNGNDQITAGNGATTVVAGTGTDNVQLGNGNDQVTLGAAGGTRNDNVQLGDGNDQVTLLNTSGNAQVQTGNGTDTVSGAVGNGNDTVHLGSGNNKVTLGNGNDQVQSQPGTGNNNVVLGTGIDSVNLADGKNTVTVGGPAGGGNDNIHLGNGNNAVTLLNSTGNDQVLSGAGTNNVTGGNANVNVNLGNGSNNSVTLGNGHDSVQIGNGKQEFVMVGNGSDSILLGNDSFDVITIGTGTDSVQFGSGSNNTVYEPVSVNPQTKIKFGSGGNNTIK